jgi:ABC-2 type transport system permease protein
LSTVFFTRVDLTSDKRFTLTDSTKKLLRNLNDVVFVKVYLEGDFPAGFKRLATSTREMLNEFKVYGGDKIQYEFIDPTAGKTEKELNDVLREFAQKGLEPTNVQTKSGDEYSQKIIIPGTVINYKGKEAAINLLDNTPGTGAQVALNNSVAHLEDKFSQAIEELSLLRLPKIAFITGQGELNPAAVADFTHSLSSFYEVKFLNPDSLVQIKNDYAAIVIARPSLQFSEQTKFKIDQYLMRGGRILWMVETLNADLDSVIKRQSFITTDFPLNLDDQLFKYGVRINPDLLLDLQCNPVPLLVNYEGSKPNFKLFPCYYFPVLTPQQNHPIVQNIDAVETRFPNTIDTIAAKGIRKTILLSSSDKSRKVFTPWLVDFRELKNRPDEKAFNKKDLVTAVLLEGPFTSAYYNRVPEEMQRVLMDSLKIPFLEKGNPSKMIVIADGDVARNDFNAQGQPLALGFYRYTGEYFGNKNFLLNCIDYLTGHDQHIDTRSKTMQLRLLDAARSKDERLKWQLINLLVPLALLGVFGLIFNFIRTRKFTR